MTEIQPQLSEAEKGLYWLTHLKEQEGFQEWLYLGDLIILSGVFLCSLAPLVPVLAFPRWWQTLATWHFPYYLSNSRHSSH